MALDDDIAVLSRVALFEKMGNDELRLLAFGAEPLHLAQGELLCCMNEAADGGFVLVAGKLARLIGNTQNIDRTFTETGTLIGELSLLTRCTWQSTIAAETSCRLLKLPRTLFRRILEEYPQIALELEKNLTADLSAKVRAMETVARKLG